MYPGKGRQSKYDHPPATFDLFDKVDVQGPKAHPVFIFLHQAMREVHSERAPRFHEVASEARIKGNFNKWIIDKHGRPRAHFGKRASLADMEPTIRALLDEDLSP